MSFYDIKVRSLEELPSLSGLMVVSDCDGTLFEHGTDTVYPDVKPVLCAVGGLALVSAFPDSNLMSKRQNILDADISIHSQKARWYKGDLFAQTANYLDETIDKLIIIGDRPIADIGVAKMVFGRRGYKTLGVRVDRPGQPLPHKVDYLLRPGFLASSALIKLAKQDKYFRPNPEEGQKRVAEFLTESRGSYLESTDDDNLM